MIVSLHTVIGTGLSSLGVPGVPWHTQILADQLTLFQPGGTDYAQPITTGTPGFSDLPTALRETQKSLFLPVMTLPVYYFGNFQIPRPLSELPTALRFLLYVLVLFYILSVKFSSFFTCTNRTISNIIFLLHEK